MFSSGILVFLIIIDVVFYIGQMLDELDHLKKVLLKLSDVE